MQQDTEFDQSLSKIRFVSLQGQKTLIPEDESQDGLPSQIPEIMVVFSKKTALDISGRHNLVFEETGIDPKKPKNSKKKGPPYIFGKYATLYFQKYGPANSGEGEPFLSFEFLLFEKLTL